MPALSPTMTAGNIASIKVKVGDKISPGDLIMDIETDKATMGWEAQEEGHVAAILVKEGDQEVQVGQVVLAMVDDPADIPNFSDYTASAPAAPAAPTAPTTPSAPPPPPAASVPLGGGALKGGSGSKVPRVGASPLARALAREAGLDFTLATPTGPHGYVDIRCDVMRVARPLQVGAASVSGVLCLHCIRIASLCGWEGRWCTIAGNAWRQWQILSGATSP